MYTCPHSAFNPVPSCTIIISSRIAMREHLSIVFVSNMVERNASICRSSVEKQKSHKTKQQHRANQNAGTGLFGYGRSLVRTGS